MSYQIVKISKVLQKNTFNKSKFPFQNGQKRRRKKMTPTASLKPNLQQKIQIFLQITNLLTNTEILAPELVGLIKTRKGLSCHIKLWKYQKCCKKNTFNKSKFPFQNGKRRRKKWRQPLHWSPTSNKKFKYFCRLQTF